MNILKVNKVKSLSRVQFFATPWSVAYQALPSMGFSRHEYWSGLPFPSPMRESEVVQLCPTLSNPMDCSLPGSSIHGIFQARVLEWGAIAFSASLLSLLINFEMSWPIFALKKLHISAPHEKPLLLPLYWGLYLKVIHNVDKGCWIPNTSGFHMQNPS